MKSKIIIVLLFLYGTLSYAQKQPVKLFFKDGKVETKTCRKTRFNTVKCFEDDKQSIKYNERDLIAVEIERDGKLNRYVYLNIKNQGQKLVLEVVNGKVSLYERDAVSKEGLYTIMYIKRECENIATLAGFDGGYVKSKIKKYFVDCPILIQSLKNKEFKKKKAEDIVNYYNENCK